MDRFVARLNIEKFRKRLEVETDDAKRQTLLRLLDEELAKLVHRFDEIDHMGGIHFC
jgi:hypothetical protein